MTTSLLLKPICLSCSKRVTPDPMRLKTTQSVQYCEESSAVNSHRTRHQLLRRASALRRPPPPSAALVSHPGSVSAADQCNLVGLLPLGSLSVTWAGAHTTPQGSPRRGSLNQGNARSKQQALWAAAQLRAAACGPLSQGREACPCFPPRPAWGSKRLRAAQPAVLKLRACADYSLGPLCPTQQTPLG